MEESVFVDFLIDKKTWNLVLKKLKPNMALLLKDYLRIKKGYMHSKVRKELVLPIRSDNNATGFFRSNCQRYKEPSLFSQDGITEIEKAILEVLVETQGLSEKVTYQSNFGKPPEPVVEQYELNKLVEKGFFYLIRNEDIYKIGITDNLLRRFNQLKPDEVLNVVRCSNFESLEKELHKKFKEFRIPQTEYFRLNKNQLEQVNIEMTKGADF